MKKFKVASHFSQKALQKIMNSQTEARALRGWNVIYFAYKNPDLNADKVADNLGVSRSYVINVVRGYNKRGKNWYVPDRRGGRRCKRCHLSLEDEKMFMKSLEEEALLGKVLTFRHIKCKVEDKVGKVVSDDYIWDLFSRHGWSKKAPRQHHPKADKAAQEEYLYFVRSMKYKKNSKKIWLPNH